MRYGPAEHGGIRERWVNLVTGEEAAVCHDGTVLTITGWKLALTRKLKRDPAWRLLVREPPKLKGLKPGRKVKIKNIP